MRSELALKNLKKKKPIRFIFTKLDTQAQRTSEANHIQNYCTSLPETTKK